MAVTTFHGIPDGKGKATPWFASVAWAMQGTAFVMTILVFLLYWGLDFAVVCGSAAGCPVVDFANIAVHGINALLMVIDILVCKQPFHLAHIFMPAIYALAYLIFNIIWQAATSEVVYMVLDWGQSAGLASSIAAGVVLIAVPLCYILGWCVTRARACSCCTGVHKPAEIAAV